MKKGGVKKAALISLELPEEEKVVNQTELVVRYLFDDKIVIDKILLLIGKVNDAELLYDLLLTFLELIRLGKKDYILGLHLGVNLRSIIFDNPLMEVASNQELYDIEMMRTESKVKSGLYKCKKCGSLATISIQVQSSRGDEQTASLVKCTNCGFKWKEG